MLLDTNCKQVKSVTLELVLLSELVSTSLDGTKAAESQWTCVLDYISNVADEILLQGPEQCWLHWKLAHCPRQSDLPADLVSPFQTSAHSSCTA